MEVDTSALQLLRQAEAEAKELLQLDNVGGFLTTTALLAKLAPAVKNRVSFDVVEPKLYFKGEKVMVQTPRGEELELFHMNAPLIEQLIHLKCFIVPENLDFFVKWVRQVHARTSDMLGRSLIFAPSPKAELWFSQRDLPTISMDNPLQGVIQTVAHTKLESSKSFY